MRLATAAMVMILLAGVPAHADVADRQKRQMIERVVALQDRCQQQALIQGVGQELARSGWPMPVHSVPSDVALSRFAWQQHLFHVFAGLAGQWTVAQWSREGAAMAARVHAGTEAWIDVQTALEKWQEAGAEVLDVQDADCRTQALTGSTRKLGKTLSRWIIDSAADGIPVD